jgi:hypothetical protein
VADRTLLFTCEREQRCRAALARDLAATVTDRSARQRHLAEAALRASALPGSLNETTLILR